MTKFEPFAAAATLAMMFISSSYINVHPVKFDQNEALFAQSEHYYTGQGDGKPLMDTESMRISEYNFVLKCHLLTHSRVFSCGRGRRVAFHERTINVVVA